MKSLLLFLLPLAAWAQFTPCSAPCSVNAPAFSLTQDGIDAVYRWLPTQTSQTVTLAADVSAVDTTITVASGDQSKITQQFTGIVCGNEVMVSTAKSGQVITVNRGLFVNPGDSGNVWVAATTHASGSTCGVLTYQLKGATLMEQAVKAFAINAINAIAGQVGSRNIDPLNAAVSNSKAQATALANGAAQ